MAQHPDETSLKVKQYCKEPFCGRILSSQRSREAGYCYEHGGRGLLAKARRVA